MDINKFAQEIHQNAVDHGFWEGESDLAGQIIALIHSEFSEALEEYRAFRPMVWYNCNEIATSEPNPCNPKDLADCLNYEIQANCKYRGEKPEGIAIELIDGCIRILDYVAWVGMSITNFDTLDKLMDLAPKELYNVGLPTLVARLHWYVSKAYSWDGVPADLRKAQEQASYLFDALAVACAWIRKEGYKPEELMTTKHNYNKSRPYKHGKKC